MANGIRTPDVFEPLNLQPEAVAVSRSNSAFASSDWWQLLERSPRSILLLDYDGTLSPFVRERMRAKMYPGIAERLLRLAAAPRTRLVLVSGRPARDLASLLPSGLRVEIWGSHGRERISVDCRYTATPLKPSQEQCLTELETELRRLGLASLIERKIGSLAIHTRGLAESSAEHVIALARAFRCSLSIEPGDPGVEWLTFDGGIELRGTGCTKGTAVVRILSEEPPGTPAAYLGDDQTDEEAFVALHAYAPGSPSLRVLVRREPRPSAADLWLTPPDQLLAFLDRWLAAVVPTHDPQSEAAL